MATTIKPKRDGLFRLSGLLGSVVLIAGVLFFQTGCQTIAKQPPKGIHTPSPKLRYSSPEGEAYYLFMESQLQRKHKRLEKAVDFLLRAISKDPDSTYLKEELVDLYIKQNKNDKALDILEQLLDADPDNLEAQFLYARLNHEMGNFDAARQTYESLLEADPMLEDIYLQLGQILRENQDDEEALNVYQRLIENIPSSYAGHFFLGRLFADQGDLDTAEAEFQKTLELQPDLQEPLFELLAIYKKREQHADAMDMCHKILAQDPDNIEAAMELAFQLHLTGKPEAAGDILEKLGQRSLQDNQVIRDVVRVYLDSDQYEAAAVILEGMLKGAPADSTLHYIMGLTQSGLNAGDKAALHFNQVQADSRFYKNAILQIALIQLEKGDPSKAIDLLTKLYTKFPGDVDILHHLGIAYAQKRDYAKAENVLKQAILISPNDPELHYRLGVILDTWGRKTDAMAQMRNVLKLAPEHASALNHLGYSYAELGQNLDEAEKLIQKALELRPDDGYITDSLGWVYYKKGLFPKALETLKKAVALVPDDPIILEHLGDAFAKTQDVPKALEYYRHSLKQLRLDLESEPDPDDRAAEDIRRLEHKILELQGEGS